MVSDARASSGAPEEFGVRFYLIDSPAQGKALASDFVEFPEPRDQVAEEQGLPVYVAPELAPVGSRSSRVMRTQRLPSSGQLSRLPIAPI